MKKKLSLLLAVLMLTVLLAGCVGPTLGGDPTEPTEPETRDGLPLSEEEERRIAEDFLEYLRSGYPQRQEVVSVAEELSAEDLSVRLFGRFYDGDLLAVMIDGVFDHAPVITDFNSRGYEFLFPTTQRLILYYHGEFDVLGPFLSERPLRHRLSVEDWESLYRNFKALQDPVEIPEIEERTLTGEEEEMIWGWYENEYGESYRSQRQLVFYGCYNGVYVVDTHRTTGRELPFYYEPYLISGVYFSFGDPPVIWYDGRPYSWRSGAHELYEQGLLTREDLLDLQNYYHWYWNGLFDEELDLYWFVDWEKSSYN